MTINQFGERAPKVFLSHATEDKDRFVLGFARRLRENGVDVWLDRWEMYPGDSLIDKIFEEGLKEADAVIIVLSSVSVDKKWVREELNTAVVKRINSGSQLIPVVIDNCEVPQSLRNLVWEKVSDLNNYPEELDRILASIFGYRSKPPIGPSPQYFREEVPSIPTLSHTDTLVLRAVGEEVFTSGDRLTVYTDRLWKKIEPLGVPRQEFEESLLILVEMGFIEKGRNVASFPTYFSPTIRGIEKYALAFLESYSEIKEQVKAALINTELRDNDDIAEDIHQPVVVVTHILYALEMSGLLKTSGALGGKVWARDLSPRLKRTLR